MISDIESPKANPENLLVLVKQAYEGRVVVPDFQRSFVWSREDIEELLVSIFLGYFIGTFLMLDTSSSDPLFPFRPIEGLARVNPHANPSSQSTIRLILDGQQRITSLFYALYEPDIPLKWTSYPYRFFLRLDRALVGEIEDAIEGISQWDTRRVKEIQQLVQAHRALPISSLREAGRFYRWLYNEQTAWPSHDERNQIEALFQRLAQFMIPVVALPRETGKDNIVNIFERINRTGVRLSLFDLAAARLYVKNVKLHELWKAFEGGEPDAAEIVRPESFLRIIALMEGKVPRKGNLIDVVDSLDKPSFERRWHEATKAVVAAHERIRYHYGAFNERLIPYSTMVVPLAVMLHMLEHRHAGEKDYRKIDRWYWGSVFSERYDSAVDTKSYQDVRDLGHWIDGGQVPEWLERLRFEDEDLAVAESRSAMYRGLMCLVVLQGARDFLTGNPAPLSTCQDDHIFPKAVYRNLYAVDSILNRTLISESSNAAKGSKKPSEFITICLQHHGNDEHRLLLTLRSHFISGEGYRALLADDFEAFVAARGQMFARAVASVLCEGTPDVVTPA